ncbi:MAG: DNA polymerase III subunit delta' [Campylobacterota bacterium]|nr:DNA polymerase III subunit delta' [Campylobacterota bacterium]
MLASDSKKSHILITTEIESEFERLRDSLSPLRVIGFIEDEFKLENAKAVVYEAYITTSQTKYIILGANSFNTVSQNSLLKILEEPPKNIEFIILSPSVSVLLPTVRSRLPIIKGNIIHKSLDISLNLARVDYGEVFQFLKENSRIKKAEAKLLVEALYRQATIKDRLILSIKQLENFEKAYKLLELNSRPQSVLAMLVMSFVQER